MEGLHGTQLLIETSHEMEAPMSALAKKIEHEDVVETDTHTEQLVKAAELKVVPLPRRSDDVYMRGIRRRRA